MTRLRTLVPVLALVALVAFPTLARADFGLLPGSPTVTAVNRDGTIDTQAGSHPYAFTVHFAVNTDVNGKSEGGVLRDVLTNLPPGLIGNPNAVPACPRNRFEGAEPLCEANTQIGVLRVILPELNGEFVGPLFNLEPPPGVAAQFGFSKVDFKALLSATVSPEGGYGVHIEAANLPLEATEVTATIWGTPADPSHDPERGIGGGESTEAPLLPFLTLPASCGAAPQVRFELDSRLAPGAFVGGDDPAIMRDKGGNPLSLTGCEAVPFSPAVSATPTAGSAESASGFEFQLTLPNQGLLNSNEGSITETEPEKTVVTLPVGVTANPAAVGGQGVCTLAQYEATDCPGNSKLGTLFARTPLLNEAIEGSVYLAAPHDNPFNSLLALYVIARSPLRGVLVKQAGRIDADPTTGQLTTTIEGLPPIPYSGFDLRLREGARAPLITPQACGQYQTTAVLYPFSGPGAGTVRTAPFGISTGANGGGCASSEAGLAFNPVFQAGTITPIAGSYSPFVFNLNRGDGEQRLASLEATLPKGLVARIAGVPYCSDAAIAAASSRLGEGEGAIEVARPSCSSASQLGIVKVSAGAGPLPYSVEGKAYLAGPYKGAPLSLEIITPAIAGPFDLGSVAVRTALYVNESTAQVHAVSDPLPTILHGIPLDVRSVSLQLNRPEFTLNPTNCTPSSVTGKATSLTGRGAPLSSSFGVGGCKALDFKPNLKLKFSGETKRTGYPAVKAVLTQPKGENANLADASVVLPKGMLIANAHVNNPCTRVQFNSTPVPGEGCPPKSVLGNAKVWSPLLEKPEQGKVYFRSNGGERLLPDLVVALRGQIPLQLVGFIDSVGKKGAEVRRVRSRFLNIPDAPVSRFELTLAGGKRGLLENSKNLCKSKNIAKFDLTGQNGKTSLTEPKLEVQCGKGSGKSGAKKKKK